MLSLMSATCLHCAIIIYIPLFCYKSHCRKQQDLKRKADDRVPEADDSDVSVFWASDEDCWKPKTTKENGNEMSG